MKFGIREKPIIGQYVFLMHQELEIQYTARCTYNDFHLFFFNKKISVILIISLSLIPFLFLTRYIDGNFVFDGILLNSYIVIFSSVSFSLLIWLCCKFVFKTKNNNWLFAVLLGLIIILPLFTIIGPITAIILGAIAGCISFFIIYKR